MSGKKKVEDLIDDDDDEKKEDGGGDKGYSWEEEFKRSWEVVQEDDSGSLKSLVATLQQQLKKRRLQRDTSIVQRGIIRHLFVIIDLSEAMAVKDMRPTRIGLTMAYLESFIIEYFDQNPISQLGIITTKNGLAEKISELGGNPMEHIKAIKMKANRETSGEPSLQNALFLAKSSLIHVPLHASREILCIFGSLTTCDPGNIHDTADDLKRLAIRCSVIGLAAEVQVFKSLCNVTKGLYSVAFNEHHFRDVLFDMTHPPAVGADQKNATTLVMMGFPKKCEESDTSLCACHTEPLSSGFKCPRCAAKICELPTECNICNLTLISSPHLARSYHHLFPIENFTELPISRIKQKACSGCNKKFPTIPSPQDSQKPRNSDASEHYQCPKCNHEFCLDCDLFIHDSLHNCPGCTMV
ncbi:hypothetical protein DSO57_1008521 [Entomophthora muscae]|uniref:Uncharacterized protein n=2 Tax=Entomophthora muscae TaxID=34485 RepID=A0ACC2UHN7_9FUNG|nr:hypothetical protein DSO57_1008521 [Entomophthora muscae]